MKLRVLTLLERNAVLPELPFSINGKTRSTRDPGSKRHVCFCSVMGALQRHESFWQRHESFWQRHGSFWQRHESFWQRH